MWKKRIRKACLFLTKLSLLILVASICFVCAVMLIHEYYSKTAKLPENGTYYCEELDATIEFVNARECYYRNGNPDDILTPPGGTNAWFITRSTEIRAYYRWDQKQDILKIRFSKYPEEFDAKRTYVFRKTN